MNIKGTYLCPVTTVVSDVNYTIQFNCTNNKYDNITTSYDEDNEKIMYMSMYVHVQCTAKQCFMWKLIVDDILFVQDRSV